MTTEKLKKINNRKFEEPQEDGRSFIWAKEPEHTDAKLTKLELITHYGYVNDNLLSEFGEKFRDETALSYEKAKIDERKEIEFLINQTKEIQKQPEIRKEISALIEFDDSFSFIDSEGNITGHTDKGRITISSREHKSFFWDEGSTYKGWGTKEESYPVDLFFDCCLPDTIFSKLCDQVAEYPDGMINLRLLVDAFRSEVDRSLQDPLWGFRKTLYVGKEDMNFFFPQTVSFSRNDPRDVSIEIEEPDEDENENEESDIGDARANHSNFHQNNTDSTLLLAAKKLQWPLWFLVIIGFFMLLA